jgi:RNA polymerase sigma-70 factor (ECF subfamily)
MDWARVYQQDGARLLAYLDRFVRNRADADDLLQDTFVRAMRASRVPPDDQVTPWLYTIASRVAISALRRARLRRFVGLDRVEVVAERVEPDDVVRAALRCIPPDQAVAIVLALHDGFSRRQAAAILGVPAETFKSRLARARVNFAREYVRLTGC